MNTLLRLLPISIYGVVQQLIPIMVVFFAYFVLGERLDFPKIVTMLLALTGAIMIVVGMESKEENVVEFSKWLLIILAANTLLIAYAEVLLRKMRKLPVTTMLCYTNFSMSLYGCLMMWIMSESFDLFTVLDSTSLLLVSSITVAMVFKTVLKYWAY